MTLYFKQFFTILSLIILNMITLCVTFIDWNWNLTANIRILVPILLFSFLHPSVAMLGVDGILDSIEPNISRENIGYHTRDKKLDLWGQFVGFIALWLIPSMKHYRIVLTILFFIRFVGTLLFLQTENKKFLALFPNYYSMIYILLPFLDNLNNIFPFMKSYRLYVVLIAFIGKTIAEYFHHYSSKKKSILGFRKYVKHICKGKQKMYMKTGTYPLNKQRLHEETPIFKV